MAGEILAQLPADLQTHEAFTGMNTAGDLAAALLDTKGKVAEYEGKVNELQGKVTTLETSSILKLTDNATPEQRDAFFKSLGRPDKAEQYELAPAAEGRQISPALEAAAKVAFHANGLNGEQAKNISAWWNTYIGETIKAEAAQREKARNEAEVTLKAELGDKYDASVELVKRVWNKFSSTEFDAFVNETKLGNDPRLIRFMVNVAKLTGEDKSPAGGPPRGQPGDGKGISYDKSPAPPAH